MKYKYGLNAVEEMFSEFVKRVETLEIQVKCLRKQVIDLEHGGSYRDATEENCKFLFADHCPDCNAPYGSCEGDINGCG